MRAALSIVWLIVACDAGAKPQPPPAPSVPPKPQVQWTATAIGPDLRYLAADSDLIVHVAAAEFHHNKLWSTYEADLTKMFMPDLVGCAYAPLRDVKTFDIGVSVKTGLGVLVARGPDRDKTLACLRGRAGVHFEGDLATVPHGSEVDAVTFVDATTMVMQRGKQVTIAGLNKVVHDGGVSRSAALDAAIKRLPPHAAVTVVSRPDSEEMRSKLGQAGVKFKYFYGSLDVTDQPLGIVLRYAMVLATPDEAAQLDKMLKGQLTSLKQMLDRIDVAAQGDTMTVEIGMSEAKLAAMVAMMKPMVSTP